MSDFFILWKMIGSNQLSCLGNEMYGYRQSYKYTGFTPGRRDGLTLKAGEKDPLSLPIHITLDIEISALCHMNVIVHYLTSVTANHKAGLPPGHFKAFVPYDI